ncbi:MAG: hypothetical protein LBQ92_05525, partial [Propionibacteriaceae bacterium]|nr:hypothetical protein [Propionibacteriaceae bacterium]
MDNYAGRLAAVTAARGAFCVGLDPHPALLAAWGLADDPEGLEYFCATAIDALGERAAAFKPQSAFFERHGSAGIAVLERVLARIRAVLRNRELLAQISARESRLSLA